MALDLFDLHEELFLTEKAKEWGWRNNVAKIFVGRMLSQNNHLSHENLNKDELKILGDDGITIGNIVPDTLCNTIIKQLRSEGCPEGNWRTAQQWLKEVLFPKWVKPLAWQELWVLGQPNPDIEVEVVQISTAGCVPADYLPLEVPLGQNIRYHIPMNAGEHLILLEKDGNDEISCLQPSRHSQYKFNEIVREELIAIVSPHKPQVEWLETARHGKGFLEVEYHHVESLMDWVNKPQNSCQLWRFEVQIVMPKIEPVVTVAF